jgi:site-specific DNA recombinase
LAQEFNSLDAQREAAEAYIQSQRHEGWEALPTSYDDGGYSGGSMDRPALRRMLEDIESGKIDCVVVYKVDRLSRSLLDFARIVEKFESHGVTFVSVTQQFNTTASLGRLTLNILLSFAQFEREIIGERTRDKMSAARRKGKWVGGIPVLGYDIAPGGGRLIVNKDEALRVRALFDLYVQHRSLITVVTEANRRGWTLKGWTTLDGREHQGGAITKSSLCRLLKNVVYIGRVNHKGTVYAGEQPAIVDEAIWRRVNEQLRHNGATGGVELRNRHGALLRGLLHCEACHAAMVHTFTVRNSRRYRYYVCLKAQQQGWCSCPSKSLSANRIEEAVIDRIRGLGTDLQVLKATVARMNELTTSRAMELRTEIRIADKEMQRLRVEMTRVVASQGGGMRVDRLADLQARISQLGAQVAEARQELTKQEVDVVSMEDVQTALENFDPIWKILNTQEQMQIVKGVLERVGYDGRTGKVAVTFRSGGMKALCEGLR